MTTTARLRYALISPQKLRLVADQIRGRPVSEALERLEFSDKKGAAMLRKTLAAAIANAEHNDGADIDELTVAAVMVDKGPIYKRLQPRARGRADRILKRTSHLSVTVEETAEE